MKKVLCGLLACISINSFATIGDSGMPITINKTFNIKSADKYGNIYFTNTFGDDVLIFSQNKPNNLNYDHFSCLIPIPKEQQNGVLSPPFQTYQTGYDQNNKPTYSSGVILKKGQTIKYAVDTICDKTGDGTSDDFAIGHVDILNRNSLLGLYFGLHIEDKELKIFRAVNKWNEITIQPTYSFQSRYDMYFVMTKSIQK